MKSVSYQNIPGKSVSQWLNTFPAPLLLLLPVLEGRVLTSALCQNWLSPPVWQDRKPTSSARNGISKGLYSTFKGSNDLMTMHNGRLHCQRVLLFNLRLSRHCKTLHL